MSFSTISELGAVWGLHKKLKCNIFCSLHYDLFPIENQSQKLSALHANFVAAVTPCYPLGLNFVAAVTQTVSWEI